MNNIEIEGIPRYPKDSGVRNCKSTSITCDLFPFCASQILEGLNMYAESSTVFLTCIFHDLIYQSTSWHRSLQFSKQNIFCIPKIWSRLSGNTMEFRSSDEFGSISLNK